MHTIILITTQKEFLIGRAEKVTVEKVPWKKGLLNITNAWLASSRVVGNKWERKIFTPFFGPPKRFINLTEKIYSNKRHKHCTVYTLSSGEIIITYDKPPNSNSNG